MVWIATLIGLLAADPSGLKRACVGTVRGEVFDATTGRSYPHIGAKIEGLNRESTIPFLDSKFEFLAIPCGERVLVVEVMEGLTNPTTHTIGVPVQVTEGFDSTLRVPVLLDATKPATARDLVVGRDAKTSGPFEVRIRTAPRHLRVGDHPGFQVKIRNRSKSPAWLVRALDGSCEGGRSPRIDMKIAGPFRGFQYQSYGRCGNTSGMGPDDIVQIDPGKEFDPFVRESMPYGIAAGSFALPGRYRVTFTYSSMEQDSRRWSGSPSHQLQDDIAARLALVSRVELSDSLEFDVAP
jgi:hypothetical protein